MPAHTTRRVHVYKKCDLYRPLNFDTSSASLLRLSARCPATGPPTYAAALPNLVKITASRTGLTAAYDPCRMLGSIYAETASERMMFMDCCQPLPSPQGRHSPA